MRRQATGAQRRFTGKDKRQSQEKGGNGQKGATPARGLPKGPGAAAETRNLHLGLASLLERKETNTDYVR